MKLVRLLVLRILADEPESAPSTDGTVGGTGEPNVTSGATKSASLSGSGT